MNMQIQYINIITTSTSTSTSTSIQCKIFFFMLLWYCWNGHRVHYYITNMSQAWKKIDMYTVYVWIGDFLSWLQFMVRTHSSAKNITLYLLKDTVYFRWWAQFSHFVHLFPMTMQTPRICTCTPWKLKKRVT